MEKIKNIISVALSILVVLIIISSCSNCSTCNKKIDATKAGLYDFNQSTCDYFVKVETDSVGKNEFSSAVSSVSFSGTVTRLKADIFDNCSLTFEITVNNTKVLKTLNLNSDGTASFEYSIKIAPAYKTKLSYKIVEAQGTVIKQASGYDEIEFNGLTFTYGENYAYLANTVTKKQARRLKVIYVKDYMYAPEGTRLGFVGSNVFNLVARGIFKPSPLKKVETIIFDGDFLIENIGYADGFKNIKQSYPNLKNIVIKNLKTKETEKNYAISLPESGVNFYVNDETGFFTELLSRTYFVNGVYSFDEFDIEKYRKEYDY